MSQPEKYAYHNISGAIQLLNVATESGVQYFIFSSTAAVYGNPQYIPMDEEHPTVPSNFYGYTKLAIEELLSWYAQLKGLRFASLRYFNAAGFDLDGKIKGLENEPNNLLPIVMEAVIGKRPFVEVFGTDYKTQDGSCIRDYVHVNDLADGHVRALEYLTREPHNPILNLGTSNGMSVLEILEHTKNLSSTNFDVRFGSRRPGDPAIVLAKAAKAKSLIGWEAKHSDPKTLINSMLNVYKAVR
jgi:UDP-glucose 4-epimerase